MEDNMEYAKFRKKRVAMLKKIIIATVIVLILLPTFLCIILFIKMSKMQKQLDLVLEQRYLVAQNQANLAGADDGMDGALFNENVDNHDIKDSTEYNVKNTIKDSDKYDGKLVYLTFDDGPSESTEDILDKLADYDAKATFFVVMKTDEKSIECYKKIVAQGHTLAMHSSSHVYANIYSDIDAYIDDVTELQNYLNEVTDVKPDIYRFPGGSSNTVSKVDIHECIDFLDDNNIAYFDWNVASGDAESRILPAQTIAANVIKGIEANDIAVVLMHDAKSKRSTVDSLDEILTYVNEIGANAIAITESTVPLHHKIKE